MNLPQILYRHRVAFRRSSADPNEYLICCPFCAENRGERDRDYCLHVNAASGAGHCWHARCGYKSRNAVYGLIRKFGGDETEHAFLEEEKPESLPVRLPADFQILYNSKDAMDREALSYLRKRGVTPMQLQNTEAGVSYVGRFAYRVIFPVRNARRLEMIVARDFTGRQKPKYLNSAGAKPIYHFDPFKSALILSEGVFKALRIEQVCGDACSASILGHDLTDLQFSQIKNSRCQQIVLWPDPDLAGRKGILRIADVLTEHWNGTVKIAWPVSVPADEAPLEDLRETLLRSVPYTYNVANKILLAQRPEPI